MILVKGALPSSTHFGKGLPRGAEVAFFFRFVDWSITALPCGISFWCTNSESAAGIHMSPPSLAPLPPPRPWVITGPEMSPRHAAAPTGSVLQMVVCVSMLISRFVLFSPSPL